jgi:2-polyprenyl-3-methyl-5-hydroxy-6-metoxy-1,4-benzoquinol methylase
VGLAAGGRMQTSKTVAFDPEATETRVIHRLIDFTGKDVLDVGCGDGRMPWRQLTAAE